MKGGLPIALPPGPVAAQILVVGGEPGRFGEVSKTNVRVSGSSLARLVTLFQPSVLSRYL